MLERRATTYDRHTARTAAALLVLPTGSQDDPVRAIPAQDYHQDGPVPAVPDELTGPPRIAAVSGSDPADALTQFARRIAAEHHTAHGQPITRDALRARLGVSNQLASDLLRQIRTTTPRHHLNGDSP